VKTKKVNLKKKLHSFSLSKSAKLLGFPGGQNKFANWLREKKYLKPDLEPFQNFWEQELFTFEVKNISKLKAPVCVTRITFKGLYHIAQKLNSIKQDEINN